MGLGKQLSLTLPFPVLFLYLANLFHQLEDVVACSTKSRGRNRFSNIYVHVHQLKFTIWGCVALAIIKPKNFWLKQVFHFVNKDVSVKRWSVLIVVKQ